MVLPALRVLDVQCNRIASLQLQPKSEPPDKNKPSRVEPEASAARSMASGARGRDVYAPAGVSVGHGQGDCGACPSLAAALPQLQELYMNHNQVCDMGALADGGLTNLSTLDLEVHGTTRRTMYT